MMYKPSIAVGYESCRPPGGGCPTVVSCVPSNETGRQRGGSPRRLSRYDKTFSVITGVSCCDEGFEHIPNRQLQRIQTSVEICIAVCLHFSADNRVPKRCPDTS